MRGEGGGVRCCKVLYGSKLKIRPISVLQWNFSNQDMVVPVQLLS